ncbi:MAG: cysteine desulfurase [Candidatus Yanofskybacteria bacterium]|nr:cysteine desulfurase [Candidatus Yanofskybacteria bacterium]
MKEIYLDHAAATPIDPGVQRVVTQTMKLYGNPSSYNDAGRQAAQELTQARKTVARFLGAHEQEIIFTSSGSEANALALRSFKNILTTPIEHKSVLENISKDSMYVSVDAEGIIDLRDLEKKLTRKTELVSVMYANNEIGTIEPIIKIGKLIKEFRSKHKIITPFFHVDACQAAEYLPMNVNQLGVDLLVLNGSKIYGPRGTGVLYVRQGTPLKPMITGGGQEFGLRAGTENVSALVGLAKAVGLIDKKEGNRLASLRDYFISKFLAIVSEAQIHGALNKDRLPNNINISIPGLGSENLLLELDKYGIRAGSGSACTARSVEPSHVLRAIGVRKPYLDGALRFSLGRGITKKEIDYLLKVLPRIVNDLKKRYHG